MEKFLKNVNDSLLQEVSAISSFYKMKRRNKVIISKDEIMLENERIKRVVITSDINAAIVLIEKEEENYALEITLDKDNNFFVKTKVAVTKLDDGSYIADYATFKNDGSKIKEYRYATKNTKTSAIPISDLNETFTLTTHQKRKHDEREFSRVMRKEHL